MFYIDSDAFILFSASGLLKEVGECCGYSIQDMRRLATLPFMLRKGRLAEKYPEEIRNSALFWCQRIPPIGDPPSQDLLQRVSVGEIDPGEALLFGLLAENKDCFLLSNDKRAMRSLSQEEGLSDVRRAISGRVACVESVLMLMFGRYGFERTASSLAIIREFDGMLRAVFSAGSQTTHASCAEGLTSYINDLLIDVGVDMLHVHS